MRNLLSVAILMGLAGIILPVQSHAGPPGSEGPVFADPKAQKRFEQWQAMMGYGPYFKQASRSLPAQSDLPDYIVQRRTIDRQALISAVRRKDKATLTVSVVSSSNPKIMTYYGEIRWRMDNTRFGPWPKGSPSGKPLGQSSTQFLDPNHGLSYDLQVLDGPSLINLKLSAKINTDQKTNRPVWETITKADQLFMERIARGILSRLRTLHLTHDTYKQ